MKKEQRKQQRVVDAIFLTVRRLPSAIIIANHFERNDIGAAIKQCLFEDDLAILKKAHAYYLGLRANPERFMFYGSAKVSGDQGAK